MPRPWFLPAFGWLTLLFEAGLAAIPDGTWPSGGQALLEASGPSHFWRKILSGSSGKVISCDVAGRIEDISDEESMPDYCYLNAARFSADTIDINSEGRSCLFKICQYKASLTFDTGSDKTEVHSWLKMPWVVVSTNHSALTCEELGTITVPFESPLDSTKRFPELCSDETLLRGGDSFSLATDLSFCTIHKCSDSTSISLDVGSSGFDSYSTLISEFIQVVDVVDGYGSDCTYLGSYEVDADVADPIPICVAVTLAKGGDTFDWLPSKSKCYTKVCREFGNMIFTDKYGGYFIYTNLGHSWSQIARAKDGMGVDCEDMGVYTIDSASRLPTACYSQALWLKADVINIDVNTSTCYFKRCESFKELSFSDSNGGFDIHSWLLPTMGTGWTQVISSKSQVTSQCESLATFSIDSEDFPQACLAHSLFLGGDTVGLENSTGTCIVYSCSDFDSLSFAPAAVGKDVYTLLSPWMEKEWPLCDANSGCVNLHLLWTAELRGRFFPVTSSGATCDPAQSEECYGGHARRATYIEERQASLALRSEKAFLLDLGGTAFGGPVWGHPDYDWGVPAAMMQNALPYDFCTLGSSDFLIHNNDAVKKEYPKSLFQRECPLLLSSLTFGSYFEGLNDVAIPFSVETLPGGSKVGFVGMMPNTLTAMQGYSADIFTIDESNRYNDMLNGDLRVVSLSSSSLAHPGEDYSEDQFNIFSLATETPTGVVTALELLRKKHQDLDALVLVCGMSTREDQIHWVAMNLPFDVIVVGGRPGKSDSDPELLVSPTNRSVLVVSSRTFLGLGSVSVRISAASGVEHYEFEYDQELDATVEANETVQALMNDLYTSIRERNSQSFGRIDNPLTGSHRVGETPPSWYQCYYMDCPASDYIGRAMLWKARDAGYSVQASFANLGGYRAALLGDENGEIFLNDCIATLSFQNTLKLYKLLGKDLYEVLKTYITTSERGFVGSGLRVAIHQPCWDFIDHADYSYYAPGSSGTEAEWQECYAAGISDSTLTIVDVQVQSTGGEWSRIEKGSTYTLVSTEYIAKKFGTFEDLDVDLGSEALGLCEYIAANQPAGVESYLAYRSRGSVRYETAAAGWSTGARLVEVKQSTAYVEKDSTCPEGKYLPEEADSCLECPIGTRSTSDSARSKCDDCATGFYGDEEGMSECRPCPTGTYSDETGRTNCTSCSAGTWSMLGSSSCWPCQVGFYSSQVAAAKCTACPIGSFADGGGATACTDCQSGFSTSTVASTSSSNCFCPSGYYRGLGGQRSSCLTCPEGMDCPFGSDAANFGANSQNSSNTEAFEGDNNDDDDEDDASTSDDLDESDEESSDEVEWATAQPLLLEGFMALEEEPLQVYRCKSKIACPGGKEGTCGSFRDAKAIACGRCVEGAYQSGDACNDCGDHWMIPFVIAALAMVVVVGLLVLFTSRDMHKQTRPASFATTAAGLQLSMLQIAGVFYHLDFTLVNPLRTFCELASVLAFDLRIARVECLFGDNPLETFTIRQIVVPACLPLALAVLLWKRRRQPDLDIISGFTNSVGSILIAFYISLIVGCAIPVLCYRHVGDNGWSLVQYPSILCFTAGDYSAMLAVGIVSFCCIPLPFTAMVLASAIRHPAALATYSRGRSAKQVERTRFLWSRFTPECHYYTVLLFFRNFLVSFVPVVANDDPVLQIGLFYAVLGGFVLIQGALRPWKHEEANWLALFGDVVLLCVLLCAGISAEADEASVRSLQGFATGCTIILSCTLLLASLLMLTKFCRHRERFDKFICHHKAASAAQARLLKTLLKAGGVHDVFIDSDNLVDLDCLFDIVKFRVGEVIVWLSGQLLTRPWCVGEIVSAKLTHNRLMVVYCENFVPIQLEDVADVRCLLDESTCQLSNYSITYEMVLEALQSLLRQTSRVYRMRTFEGIATFDQITSMILGHSFPQTPPKGDFDQVKLDSSSLLLSACSSEPEAVAAAEVVIFFVQASLSVEDGVSFVRLYDMSYRSVSLNQAVVPDSALIVLLSRDSLQDPAQLLDIEEGMVAKATIGLTVVAVSLPEFVFPGSDYYDRLQDETRPEAGENLAQLLELFFKQISIHMPIHASEEAILLGCDTIRQRILSRKRANNSPSSTATNGWESRRMQFLASCSIRFGTPAASGITTPVDPSDLGRREPRTRALGLNVQDSPTSSQCSPGPDRMANSEVKVAEATEVGLECRGNVHFFNL